MVIESNCENAWFTVGHMTMICNVCAIPAIAGMAYCSILLILELLTNGPGRILHNTTHMIILS